MRSFRFTNLLATKGMARQNTLRDCVLTGLVSFIVERLLRWLKPIFHFKRYFRLGSTTAAHLRVGKRGDKIAVGFLRKSGYKVLFRNFRAKSGGEIDLFCRDRRATVPVIVQVTTRTTVLFRDPN